MEREHKRVQKDAGQPEISVLVPVYNVERYLGQCLDSLLAQTFENFELICVDDGSQDRSGAILDAYGASDPRIRVIHKKNTGYGNSMNVALEHAKGKYVAILESDDFAEPDMLQKLYDTAGAQEADVVKGTFYNYRDGESVRSERLDGYPKGRLLNGRSFPKLLDLADTIWSCLYKRSFLLEHDIRFHETPGASYQDISFALQVWLQADRVCLIEDALLHYRRDNPASSMNNPSKLFCVFEEYQWVEEKLGHILTDSPVLRRYFTAARYRDYLDHYHRVGARYQYALLVRLESSFHGDRKRGWVAEEAFLPAVWGKLQEILADRDGFFGRTARPLPDARLAACRFENIPIYANAFFEQLKQYPKVFIYGAGQVGKRLAKAIREQGGRVDAFLVTRLAEGKTVCMDLPVMEVREAKPAADCCAVVIAVTEWSQYELYVTLKEQGFQNIFRTDEAVRTLM